MFHIAFECVTLFSSVVLAQLVERVLYTDEVDGSIPSGNITSETFFCTQIY